jgi:hypothetical protein
MMLTACEWLDIFIDQQKQVRRADLKNGWWELEVAEEGEYEFELRRWPRGTGLSLRDGLPATPVTDGELEKAFTSTSPQPASESVDFLVGKNSPKMRITRRLGHDSQKGKLVFTPGSTTHVDNRSSGRIMFMLGNFLNFSIERAHLQL